MPRRNLSLLLPTPEKLATDPMIAGVTEDIRTVTPGVLYASYDGTYMANAVANGAVAIIAPTGTPQPDGPICFLTYDNVPNAFARIAANFFGAQPRTLVAVGSASAAHTLRTQWATDFYRAACITGSTIVAPHLSLPGDDTPFSTTNLFRTLTLLHKNGITHCAINTTGYSEDVLAALRLTDSSNLFTLHEGTA